MKKLLITAAALAMSAGLAHAADMDSNFYLSLGGGWNHAQDADFKASGIKDRVDYNEGWLGDVAIGHSWYNFRTEIEGSYRHNTVRKVKGVGASGGTGDFHSWDAMLNEYYDFHNSTPWTPYLGIGVGAAFEKANDIATTFTAGNNTSGTDTQFAYQGIAGVDFALTPSSALGLRYDYFGTTRGKFNTSSAAIGKATAENQNQAVLVTYRFQW